MAPVTLYYFFSIITASGTLLWLINLAYLKKKGRTIFGQVYPIGTADYKSIIKKLANARNLAITSIITLFFLANLAWSVITVLRVNTPSAQLLLVAAPIVILIAWIFMIIKFRGEYGTQFNKEMRKKTSRKHIKDDDSWLS